jgi:hypothetical protein
VEVADQNHFSEGVRRAQDQDALDGGQDKEAQHADSSYEEGAASAEARCSLLEVRDGAQSWAMQLVVGRHSAEEEEELA